MKTIGSRAARIRWVFFVVSLVPAVTAAAGEYTLAPDGSYVSGDSYTLTPDGSYVGGDTYTLAPDGSYVGGETSRSPQMAPMSVVTPPRLLQTAPM
jgi:hypothetical protein